MVITFIMPSWMEDVEPVHGAQPQCYCVGMRGWPHLADIAYFNVYHIYCNERWRMLSLCSQHFLKILCQTRCVNLRIVRYLTDLGEECEDACFFEALPVCPQQHIRQVPACGFGFWDPEP